MRFWPRVAPLIWCSSPPGCCSQSHEILLNKGIKYWDSGSNAQSSRTFITTVHIAAIVIRWRLLGKERTGQTQFSTKFATKLSSYALKPSILFFPVFWDLIPYVTKQGVPMSSISDFTNKFIFIKERRQAGYRIFLFLAFHLYLLCLTEAFVGTHSEWV